MYRLTLSFTTLLFVSLFCVLSSLSGAERLARCVPETVGLNSQTLAYIDLAVEKSLAAKKLPGCVVCIGRHGKIALLKAYGNKQVADDNGPAVPMTIDTVFDMASLTKPIATATSVMILADRGQLELDAPVSRYMKEFDTPEKKDITVRQLLIHTAGFIADNSLKDYQEGVDTAWERLLALKPLTPPGEQYRYSDVSFQTLGKLVERVSGQNVHEFSQGNIFKPLGMDETGYVPNEALSQRAAKTLNDQPLGKVHDPRAFLTDGIAGHAGLFSTADDIAVYGTMMLREGAFPGKTRILSAAKVREMITPNRIPGGYRGLGWDMRAGSANRPVNMSPQAFGHGGFTGTAFWVDPAYDLFVIFLSNRIHPDGKGEVNVLAGEIGEIAVQAVRDLPEDHAESIRKVREGINAWKQSVKKPDGGKVLPGLDLWRAGGPLSPKKDLVGGKRVGVISNHTGQTQDGVSIVKVFQDDPDVRLTALFSPEHGFTGTFDEAIVNDAIDPLSGLTVFSLYGKTRMPTPQMLEEVDVLVFDIQDIGARFYTYISTMLRAMEAAATDEHLVGRKTFIVLDRPNPVRGDRVEGPMLQPGRERSIACHPMPIRHSLTVGELALLFKVQRRLNLDLHIVPALGWERGADQEAAGLNWVDPSPNMKSLTAAYFYTGLCLIEFTNLSVGRGTPTPFEMFGAPWINADMLTDQLRQGAEAANLKGIRFESCRFTPPIRVYEGEECQGVRLILEDREAFLPVRFGILLASLMHKHYPEQWKTAKLNTLLLHDKTLHAILDGIDIQKIEADWQEGLKNFIEESRAFRMY